MKAKKKIIDDRDVHAEHCCVLHGCKYGDDDCPVATKQKKQSFVCETCSMYDGIKNLTMLQNVLRHKLPRCPHCGHIL
jgi:hypothetical protein